MLTHQRSLAVSARRLSVVHSLTIDHLWVFSVWALAVLFISVLPLPPNDLWWHMAAGRTMVAEGAWLQTNRWAYTVPLDAPYVYQSWLSEILMYGAWRLGDVPLLTLLRTSVIALSYGLVAWHALRRTSQGKAVALALLVAVLIGWNNWTLRPQTLALLPGALFVSVIGEYLGNRFSARWLAALPVIMVFWVNMHGSFVLGLGLLALVGLSSLVEALRRGSADRVAAWRTVRTWALVGAATVGSAMIHPLGPGIFGYVRDMLTNTPLQSYFVEWQPPSATIDPTNTGFWFFAMLLLLAALMALGARRATLTDVLWYAALAWVTIGGVRYAMWFGLILLPLLADQLAALFKPRRKLTSQPLLNISYMLLLGLALFATLPWFEPSRYLGPAAEQLFANTGRYRMLLGNTTPVGATEWIAQNPIQGRWWVDQNYTSYTIWQLPNKPVFTDLRVELFSEAIWNDYFDISRGDERSLQLINKWQITHLMLDRDFQAQLRALLLKTPGWCELYQDSRSAIIARCS